MSEDFWNAVIQSVVGSGLARDLRLNQFRKEFKRCGVAHDQISHIVTRTPLTATDTPTAVEFLPKERILPSHTLSSSSAGYGSGEADVSLSPERVGCPASTGKSSLASSRSAGSFASTSSQDRKEVLGFGRFRLPSGADAKLIRARLEEDVRQPGRGNLFSLDHFNLGPHPLVEFYNERRKSSTGTDDDPGELSPTLLMASSSERLAWHMRTEPSTTITPDGCIIQRGFVIGSDSSLPKAMCLQSSAFSGQQPLARSLPVRSLTFNEEKASRIQDNELTAAPPPPTALHTQKLRPSHPPAVKLVDVHDAENAIDSEEDEDEIPHAPPLNEQESVSARAPRRQPRSGRRGTRTRISRNERKTAQLAEPKAEELTAMKDNVLPDDDTPPPDNPAD